MLLSYLMVAVDVEESICLLYAGKVYPHFLLKLLKEVLQRSHGVLGHAHEVSEPIWLDCAVSASFTELMLLLKIKEIFFSQAIHQFGELIEIKNHFRLLSEGLVGLLIGKSGVTVRIGFLDFEFCLLLRGVEPQILVDILLVLYSHPDIELPVDFFELLAIDQVISGSVIPEHFVSYPIDDLRTDFVLLEQLQNALEHACLVWVPHAEGI